MKILSGHAIRSQKADDVIVANVENSFSYFRSVWKMRRYLKKYYGATEKLTVWKKRFNGNELNLD